MASTRLPGKILLDLGGRTILHWVIARCQAIKAADAVCCAIPDSPACDPIEAEARRLGAVVFRGSENDVLARYAGAARMLQADTILRVTSDCPLIDPAICDAVLQLRQAENADYACNNMPAAFPHGLDCEAFTYHILAEAEKQARLPSEREHVTPWMRNTPDLRRVSLQGPAGDSVDHRWTLDYPEDLAFLRELHRRAPIIEAAGMNDILHILAAHPDLSQLNSQHRHASRPTHLTTP